MNKIKQWWKSNTKEGMAYLILTGMIMLQLVNLIYCFAYLKKDFHSDEIWSYGLANSYYAPFLNSDRHNAGLEKNNAEWLPGTVLDDYLSVEADERFAYGSVYYNNSRDVHPPFYYMVLHTICSFFPGKFSWWYGFALNLVLFILSQILLFLFVRNLSGSLAFANIVCMLYGFSQGCINTFIFIRMYAMATFFVLLTIWLHSELYKKREKFRVVLPCIALTTFLGGLTHYYFLVCAGIISACFCIYYLIKKEYKRLFAYATVLLGAVGLICVVYPYAWIQLTRFKGEQTLMSGYGGFWFECRYLISYVCNELLGLPVSPLPSYVGIYLMEILLVLLVIGIPTFFLLRKEKWFKEGVRRILQAIWKKIKGTKWLFQFVMLSMVCGLIVVIGKTTGVFLMSNTATRYMFAVYPVIMVLVAELISLAAGLIVGVVRLCIKKKEWNLNRIRRWKSAFVLLGSVMLLVNIAFNATENFYFEFNGLLDLRVDELPRKANYIIALEEAWLYNCFSYYLRGVEQIYVADSNEIYQQAENLGKLKTQSDVPTYFLVKMPGWKEVVTMQEDGTVLYDDEFRQQIKDAKKIEGEKIEEYIEKYNNFFEQTGLCKKLTYLGGSVVYYRYFFVFRLD